MGSKFKKALAEAKSTTTAPIRVAIPQVDPGERAQSVAAPQPEPMLAPPSTATPPVQDIVPATRVDPRTLPVDMTVRVMPFGSHLYPDRHKQVLYEAFMLDIKPWEVIETALAEYFERRYGGSSQTDMQ